MNCSRMSPSHGLQFLTNGSSVGPCGSMALLDFPPCWRGGGVALYVREQLECIELGLGAKEERVESFWVRIKGQAPKGDIMVGVFYRPPDQEEDVDEAFYRQLQAAS